MRNVKSNLLKPIMVGKFNIFKTYAFLNHNSGHALYNTTCGRDFRLLMVVVSFRNNLTNHHADCNDGVVSLFSCSFSTLADGCRSTPERSVRTRRWCGMFV